MQSLKTVTLTAALWLCCCFLSYADLAEISLQERVKRSDAVIIGTIQETAKVSTEPDGTEYWNAICHVERYIIGPKIHDPALEEAKAISLIRIAFEQKMQKPPLGKLVEGKKYLLFLKETGPNEYEMITPYHGAFEAGQDYFVHDEQNPEYPKAVKMSFEEIVQRVTPQNPPASTDIRQQLDGATGYWYAYFREKMLGEGRALRNVHTEGEWTVFETFGHHGWGQGRVLTRFLDAQEAKIEGTQLTLNGIKAFLRSSIPSEIEEEIREIEILTGMSLKDNACSSPQKCLKWIENNEDYFFWDEENNILNIAEEFRRPNLGRAVRGVALLLKTDKTTYGQNEPIILTVAVINFLPASGKICAVFPVNARMMIHSEIVLDVRNEKGEYVHFLPPPPPPPLTAKDFKMLDGGQSIESQKEITSRFYEKPLQPGRYRIQATYQNYELGRKLNVPASCAGDSVLLEGGPAWIGKIFSSTITIEVVEGL